MRAHETNVYHALLINDDDDQPVMIAFDIEYNPVMGQKAGISVDRFDIRRRIPGRARHIPKPDLQRDGGIGVCFPKFAQQAPADDPHK